MSERCTPRFEELAASLGGVSCEDAHPVGYLNDPFELADALQPAIELVMIGAAVLTLVHAIGTLRRRGDATPLGVWLAAVVYVLVLEPPLYFPEVFGIAEQVPLVFVHNEFTVGLIYDRMPLYILLLYPAMVSLAWSLVARWDLGAGRSRLRGAALVAVCVGTVHHVFYELFDMLGPQRLWWAWDLEVATNGPRLASVPLSSMVNFALVMPAAFAFLAVLLLQRRPRTTARSVLLPAVVVGALTPLVSAPGQLPATLLQVAPGVPEAVAVTGMVALLVGGLVVTGRELARVASRARSLGTGDGVARVGLGHPVALGAAYLVALAAMWLVSLPQTLDGGPLVGSLPYVVGCFVASGAVLVVTAASRDAVPPRDTAAARPAVGGRLTP
jgi:hypothetical protein